MVAFGHHLVEGVELGEGQFVVAFVAEPVEGLADRGRSQPVGRFGELGPAFFVGELPRPVRRAV